MAIPKPVSFATLIVPAPVGVFFEADVSDGPVPVADPENYLGLSDAVGQVATYEDAGEFLWWKDGS